MSTEAMNIKLRIWRQAGPDVKGDFVEYQLDMVNEHMSFLEMLDVLNENLESKGEDPVAFEHDCREGICGSCALMINGEAHGPEAKTTSCQLHMRTFRDGDAIVVEPWRSSAFPVVKDLVVDRRAFDRIIQAGGYVSASTGSAPDANLVPISKPVADKAMDAAACISCGACVAACPNGSAMLFTSAKVAHLGLLPQGQPERYTRVKNMVEQMDQERFGSCTNYGKCQEACPKSISIEFIARMNQDYIKAQFLARNAADRQKIKVM